MSNTPIIGDDPFETFSLMTLMQDPEEGPLVTPFISGRAVTAAERAAYTRFLLERGDVRGEVLALAEELAGDALPVDCAVKRARLTELLSQVDHMWWRIVRARPYLLNCGLARDRVPAVRFAYACPRSWEELAPTQDAAVRHCGACNEAVHRADTVVTAEALARQGRCIAVPAAIADRGGYPSGRGMMVGRPAHPVQKWTQRLFGELPVDSDR